VGAPAVATATGARVARAVAEAVVAGVGPQRLVDDEVALLEGRDGPGDVAGAVVDAVLVRRRVVDELATQLLAERRVLAGVAAWGKNWQGWHYGFKLHAAIDQNGRLAAIYFTPANESDVLQLKKLVNAVTRIVVGDAGYTAQVTRRHLWRDYRCAVISPPRPKQIWLMAKWQHLLLTMRPKIEAAFGKLKGTHYLVTSFPRSVQGYALHYIRTLLGYQVGVS